MSYNDYQLTDEKNREIIRQKFDEKDSEEIADLKDILEKMREQKRHLHSMSISENINKAISVLEKNISELENIIRKSDTSDYSFIKKMRKISSKNQNFLQPNSSDVWGKIPHSREIEEHFLQINEGVIPSTPQSPTTPINPPQTIDDSTGISPPNNAIPSRNSSRRNPSQSNILSAFAKAFSINSRALFQKNAQNKGTNTSKTHYEFAEDPLRNRFHRIISTSSQCSPEKKAVTNQIDLLRLLLLFIALRPHCRYCARISAITSNQFDALTYLI